MVSYVAFYARMLVYTPNYWYLPETGRVWIFTAILSKPPFSLTHSHLSSGPAKAVTGTHARLGRIPFIQEAPNPAPWAQGLETV